MGLSLKIRPIRHVPFVLFLILSIPVLSSAADGWRTVQGNQYFTGNNDERAPVLIRTNWNKVFPAAVSWPVPMSRRILLSSLDGQLRCLDAGSGAVLWSYDCGSPVTHSAVHDGERVIVTAGRSIICLDGRSGKPVWGQTDPQNGIYVNPVIAGDRCLYGTRKKLICRSVLTGRTLWENDRPDLYGGSMTFAGDTLVVQSSDYSTRTFSVAAFRLSDGSLLWSRAIPRQGIIFTPVIYEDRVYVPAATSVVCLGLEDGRDVWTKEFDAAVNSETVFSSGRLFVSTEAGTIEILDPSDGQSEQTLRFSKGRLFFTAVGEDLLVLDTSVGTLWRSGLSGTKDALFRTGLPGSGQRFVVDDGDILLPLRNTLWSLGDGATGPEPTVPSGGPLLAGNLTDPEGNPLDGTILWPSGLRTQVSGRFSIPREQDAREITVFSPGRKVRTIALGPDGTEQPIVLEPAEKDSRFSLRNILFDYNSSTLRPESITVLDTVRSYLADSDSVRLLIRGHTDDRGGEEFNRGLSLRRAERVREYLVKNGIAESRLTVEGAGESDPASDNSTEEGRALNRRIEFVAK
jgi:outer membrane protein OmpA-like peptidoglycan-associated protein/outer membrane protein assembly factor BamB